MTLSTVISIAISLSFIYFVLSLITSEIQEVIASVLKLRAKNLKEFIIHLIGESENKDNLKITKKLYNKYLTTTSKSQSDYQEKIPKLTYISPNQFANSLIGILREELKLNNKEEDYLDDLTKVADKIKESPLPEKLKNEIIIVLRNANAKVVEPEKKFETLQQEIETWYQNSTEYASRLYQKKAIILSRVVALLLVIMFNIDTVNIIDHLSKSEVLSSTFSSTVMGVIQSSDRSDYCSENDETLDFKTCMEGIEDEVKTILDRVDNLPIGWNWSDPWKEQFTPLNSGNVINAVTGWIISAIAISMGAPFWFDILKKLTRIKSENSSKDES
ncbi:hypothetical protein [Limnoraphis robusta]|uniref:Uncharacterized protein n=1 Tax=Limnoraphis robusta CCNP1315 TaxID=3110306 RepID=A0ABU5U3N4_9CYAN|nr:hypothetical protein [Limnoraphis robusta]MEA5521680.1 hypothetical protein [Limnoraphis robusta CCNP1315]MEA5547062.1 hypothetical protein [Limnoraphis robusta CCNP1324]